MFFLITKKFNYILCLLLVLLLINITPSIAELNSSATTTNAQIISNNANKYYPNIKWVSVDDIKKSLNKQPPMSIGLDIDDTILFSSPCFYKLQNEVIAKYNLKGKSNTELYKIINNEKDFWDKLAVCDVYSFPKQSAINLIHMHQMRGDQIYFITGRHSPFNKSLDHVINDILMKVIGSNKGLHPVLYANNKTKTPLIKQYNLKIYYGDGDGDITNAQEAGAKGIRFLRASNSSYQPLPNVGKFGEEVLMASDY